MEEKFEQLPASALEEIRAARFLLEHESAGIKLLSTIGSPFERFIRWLPKPVARMIGRSINYSLRKALGIALSSVIKREGPARERKHQLLVGLTGMGGGALGMISVFAELPISTTLMLRSIAEIAREEGEDLRSIEAQLSCIEVFAFGGPSSGDDAAETGYYAVRVAMASTIAEASSYLAREGLGHMTAPTLVRFITRIGVRYGIVFTDKAIAMALPLVGAISGAVVNTVFIKHFQRKARGHFGIRRLERQWGARNVEQAYRDLA